MQCDIIIVFIFNFPLIANVNIKNQSDIEEESLEMQDISKPKVWSESEKPQRPSLLQRIRSSRSKSRDEPSSGEESEPEPEVESSVGKTISVHKHSAGVGASAGIGRVRPALKFHISGALTLRDTLRKFFFYKIF